MHHVYSFRLWLSTRVPREGYMLRLMYNNRVTLSLNGSPEATEQNTVYALKQKHCLCFMFIKFLCSKNPLARSYLQVRSKVGQVDFSSCSSDRASDIFSLNRYQHFWIYYFAKETFKHIRNWYYIQAYQAYLSLK